MDHRNILELRILQQGVHHRGVAARSGGRQRERVRTDRKQRDLFTPEELHGVHEESARAQLEFVTGVSAAEVERRLEAARKRACAQGWAWADLADEEALAWWSCRERW